VQEVQTTLPIGTIIRERYIVEDLLGKGGFGAVYLVRDQRVKGNLFALKEMVDTSKQERARFAFECEVLKRVDHPALPRIYRVFEDDKNNRAYMLMDYIDGPNLEALRQKQPQKRFTLNQVMTIMAPVMNAVSYLHQQTPPIIHRDIKPANIIVPTTNDHSMLVDFGIAKEYDPDSTTTAVRRCSPGYGAPEQYSRGTNTRTDIYGLGATFYSLLTGVVPDDAFYRMTQLGTNGIDPLEPVNRLVPGIPPAVSDAIQRAMSINSNDRFATVEQFLQALNAEGNRQQAPGPEIAPVTPIPSSFVSRKAVEDVHTVSLNRPSEDTRTKKRALLLPILLILIALALGLGAAAAYWSSLGAHRVTPPPVPTSAVHHATAVATPTSRPRPTPTLAPTPTPTLAPTPTPTQAPAPTPTPVPAGYPDVAGTHNGTVHNTNANINANMKLSLNQSQGQISGSVTISYPLAGSGTIYNGSVQKNNDIQFTVTGYNGNAPLFFSGTVNTDGSMAGQYCSIDSTGRCNLASGGQGSWSVGPGSGPAGSSFTFPSNGSIPQAYSKELLSY
jgi:serine/threonine protein kinase